MASKATDTLIILLELALFGVVVGAAVWQAPNADWDLALFGILLGFSVFSDLTSIETNRA